MLLKAESLAAHLAKPLHAIYTVHGDELLTLEAADAIRAAARQQEFNDREVLVALAHFKWEQVLAATANLSLFGERKLIDLRIPTGKPGIEGANVLKKLASKPPSDLLILISLPELNWQDEKAAWLSTLNEAGVMLKLSAPTLTEFPSWLNMRLKRQNQSASNEALHFIAERTEGNLLAAHQEVLKLGLIYPNGALTLEQVRSAVLNVARYDLDGLREALLTSDLARYVRCLEGLKQEGEALPLILWAITEEVRALTYIKQGQGEGKALAALYKEAKVWGPRQALLGKALPKWKADMLNAQLRQLAKIDRMIKGVAQGDPWTELLQIGIRLYV